jgi:peptide/nickel transport system permease protein
MIGTVDHAAASAELDFVDVRPWRERLGRLARSNSIGLLGAAIIALVGLLALAAGLIAPFDPTDQIARTLEPPGARHLLGADEYGRDVLSRLVFGARISLYVGVIAVAIALAAGASVGVVAGYYGGTVDNVVMRVVDSLFAFPSLLLAIAITGILGPGLTHAMIAIGIVSSPTYARLARGTVLSVAARDYVEAARTLGASDWTIIWRHVLPNVLAPLIVQTSLSLSGAILAEASLSFLGLGTQPPDPSWGTMLGTGRRFMETAPWVAVFPGVAITVTVLGFNLLGDGLRDALDPRLRGL